MKIPLGSNSLPWLIFMCVLSLIALVLSFVDR
jgi:hypothetical protein